MESLWTFVCELCGGTYVSQYEGAELSDAIQNWQTDELANILTLAARDIPKKYIVEVERPDEAVLLETLNDAYYWSFILNYKRLGLFNDFKTGRITIIKTA